MNVPLLTRDQILDFVTIKSILEKCDKNDVVNVISLLKSQCTNLGVMKTDFNELLKMVKREINKENRKQPRNDCSLLPRGINIIPENYEISSNGIQVAIGSFWNEVCPHLIFPVEILKDIDSGEEKVKIKYKRKNEWASDIIVDKIDIATKKGVVKLSKYGILANDDNASMLVKWFCDVESANEENIPTRFCTNSLGFSKYGFIPYSSDVVYSCQNADNKRRFDLYKEHGDYNKWLDYQIKCFDYTIPKIVIAGAYASLLLEKFGINPFGIHLWGETGKGKSVSILASASVYGYPDIKNGIVYTGNATNNGLESRLAFVKNCTFYLDELSMLSDKQIDDMIYLIMQGQGKARMNKDGNSRETYYWNCVSVSNSEMPITNDTSKGGTFNRIIQLSSDGNVFGDLDLKDLSDVFKNNYGFGAKRFIDLLDNEDVQREIKILKRDYYNAVISNTEDKQANAASCVLTAFEIARKYIYKTDKQLTVEELKPYLSTVNDISQVMRSYKKLCEWIQGNMNMFDDSEIGNKAKWGYVRSDDYINVLPYYFNEYCKTIKINDKQFLKGLKQHKLLQTDRDSYKKTVRIGNNLQRVICIKLPYVYDEDDINAKKENPKILDLNGNVIDEDSLPF